MDWVRSAESNVTNENSLDMSSNPHQNADIMLQNDEFHNLNTQNFDTNLNLNVNEMNQLINLNSQDDDKSRNDSVENMSQLILNAESPSSRIDTDGTSNQNEDNDNQNNEHASQTIDLSK